MKTKFILIVCFLIVGFNVEINAQTPVPEDYFDLYDNEPSDDDSENQNSENLNLDDMEEILNAIGAVGVFPSSAISSFKLVNEGCDSTYICMYNTLKKVFSVYRYEYLFKLKSLPLKCESEKKYLQDYALFLLTLNLDIYCIEHLHPDGNELKDVELINAMLAMRDIYFDFIEQQYDWGEEKLPLLFAYSHIRSIADPFCSEDLYEIDNSTGSIPCGCGIYSGTLDAAEKNKLLQDIRTIIDDINPMWQMQKAAEISKRLKALPCQD